MGEEQLMLVPIGVAHTSYETPADAPHQGFADGVDATIEVLDAHVDALAGIEGMFRATVVYWAQLADRNSGSDGDDDSD